MSKKSVTKRSVDALRCPPGRDRTFLWDDKLSGFGVAAYAPPNGQEKDQGKKVYVIQYRKSGKSHRMKIGEHGRLTPDQARSEAKKLLGAIESGKDPLAERIAERGAKTFGQLAQEFFTFHAEPKRKPRTSEEYRRIAKLHVLPALGQKAAKDIRKADVAKLHAKLSDRPGAANRTLALISSIWNWAVRREELPVGTNPARGIERYAENARERYLSVKELQRLGEALKRAETVGLPWAVDEQKPTAKHIPKKNRLTKLDPYAVAAIRLLIFTGARLREVLGAKWDYVDWDRGLLHLPDSKTGKKTIYLSAPALAILGALPKSSNPYIIPGLAGQYPVRKSRTGKRQSEGPKPRADLKKPWAAISRAATLQGVRLHDLRHSFAATGAGASLG
ncbi:MAG: tyrosine-type recombinase/integrase, partial [bacterium]